MDERVLVWALGRDGSLTCGLLSEAGFRAEPCRTGEDLCRAAEAGAGAVIVAAELLAPDVLGCLREVVGKQPPWSDLPVVVVAGGAPVVPEDLDGLGNVSVLARPLDLGTLMSTVRTALRARRRQYQMRDLLRQRDEADRRKDEFLGILAHELRNPLAPVRTALHLLKLAGHSGETLDRARGMMERQVGQMARLIDDLMDVSRITRGKLELRKERVDLAAVIQTAVEEARPLVEAGGHTLAVNLPPDRIRVEGDPARLAQVVSNLLNNAAKFTDKDGHIALTVRRERGGVAVAVADNGIGIPADVLPRVFDMFVQGDHSLEKTRGGLGVGLTLVQRLVEMHGGSVTARSDGPGKGSEFVVRLPTLSDRASDSPSSPDVGLTDLAGRRILVVDDNVDAAESLATLLRALGADVRTAHDGAAGVEEAEGFRPDVVVMDIGMPRLNGYDAARRIRAKRGRQPVLIALTGWGQVEDQRKSVEAGFDHHLTKPAEPTSLLSLLASVPPSAG